MKMKVDGVSEDCSTKQDNSTNNVPNVEDFKICSPSNPFKTTSTNAITSDNRLGKSILKPSLLSINSASSASNSFILRQSSFNPLNKITIDNKSDNSDKKQANGEAVKFVPLKSESQKLKSAEPVGTNHTNSNTAAKPTFIFGQNLQERVIATETIFNEPSPSTSSLNSNGTGTGTNLFSSAIKHEEKPVSLKDKETKSLTESAREYEELRANKRKYDEVQVKTGEEDETNIISISCKLFLFDKITSSWQERGRGTLRLNDFEIDENHIGSRLVFRTAGSLRVILNTKIWAEMTIDKASEKSIRFTALDSNGEIKVFLVTSSIDDSRQLFSHLHSRLEKEFALQKRKKLELNDLRGK